MNRDYKQKFLSYLNEYPGFRNTYLVCVLLTVYSRRDFPVDNVSPGSEILGDFLKILR